MIIYPEYTWKIKGYSKKDNKIYEWTWKTNKTPKKICEYFEKEYDIVYLKKVNLSFIYDFLMTPLNEISNKAMANC